MTTNNSPSPIWGARSDDRTDKRAATAADILAGAGSDITARHLAAASARNAVDMRTRAAAADPIERMDLLGWAESYWEDAIDYCEFGGVLTQTQAAWAHRLAWHDGAAWKGSLEELVTTVRAILAE